MYSQEVKEWLNDHIKDQEITRFVPSKKNKKRTVNETKVFECDIFLLFFQMQTNITMCSNYHLYAKATFQGVYVRYTCLNLYCFQYFNVYLVPP